MFRQKVIQYINEKHLFHRSDKILVALSGGADSVALLRVLLLEGYNCFAAHCNFHLRGEESDRDEEFVQNCVEGWMCHFRLYILIRTDMLPEKEFLLRWPHANLGMNGSNRYVYRLEQV